MVASTSSGSKAGCVVLGGLPTATVSGRRLLCTDHLLRLPPRDLLLLLRLKSELE